jgi:hypothetical protein
VPGCRFPGQKAAERRVRQAEGIAAARRHQTEGRMLPGKKHIGRPRAVGPAELRQLQRMTSEGTTVTQAAAS